MKKVLLALLLVVGVTACVVLGNAYRRGPAPRAVRSAEPRDLVDETRVAEHLAAAIRFRTISHEDPKDDDRSAFAELRKFLVATYPRVHVALPHEIIAEDGLLYQWAGTDPQALPILLLAHQDVVPVEPGTESKWTHPPFDGVIADGYVWGRGAIDDKASLICLFEAFESLLAEGFVPTRSMWLASGFDEEVGGRQGAKKIAEELRLRDLKFAWTLDEGGVVAQGIVPGVERPVASIAVTEKGYVSFELLSRADGGHSSMPPRETAIGILASAIDRLQKNPLPAQMTSVLEKSMEILAPEMSFGPRVALSNLWLTSPLVLRGLAGQAETNAMVRTTAAPTIIEGGIKDNVLPSSARAVVNFRILPGESIASVLGYLHKTIADDRVTIGRLERTLSEPAPVSSIETGGYEVLRSALRDVFPDALVVPSVMNGATDSRHYRAISADIYRFLPTVLVKSDLKRVHGTDERTSVSDLALMVRAYRRILQKGAGAPP